jgi:hypothetical protein
MPLCKLQAYSRQDAKDDPDNGAQNDLVEDDEVDPFADGLSDRIPVAQEDEDGKVQEGKGGAVVATRLGLE